MASFVANNNAGINMRNLWPGAGFANIVTDVATTPTTYIVELDTGIRLIYTGTGFTFSGSLPTGGTYTSIEMRSNAGATLDGTFTTGAGGALLTNIFSSTDYYQNTALLGGTSTIAGRTGADRLLGGDGNENITASGGDDTISAGAGNDTIDGGAGLDTLADLIFTTESVDVDVNFQGLQGEGSWGSISNVESLGGSASNFTTGSGDDVIVTGITSDFAGVADTIFTQDGRDTVTVVYGDDFINLGAGTDLLIVDYRHNSVGFVSGIDVSNPAEISGFISDGEAGAALDRVNFSGASFFFILGGSGGDDFKGGGGGDTIQGNAGNDTIDGGGGNDSLEGNAGSDTLMGGAGNDTLKSGLGFDDSLDGGTGNDLLFVDYTSLAVAITMSGGMTGSVNTANNQNTISYAGIERFGIYSGSANDTLRGDALADTLDGGTGADSLIGGAGDDVYAVDSLFDVVVEGVGAGTDTVYSRVNYHTMAANVEVGRLTGSATALVGNGLDNILVANDSGFGSILQAGAGQDVLYGSASNDNLDGGTGNDIFYTGGGADSCIGGAGDDQFVILGLGGSITEIAGDGIETIYLGVAGAFAADANTEIIRLFGAGNYAIGNNGNEDLVANVTASTLAGSGGDDTLWGQGAADTLFGGAGNDIFRTGGGADQCTGNEGDDSYVILDTGARVVELTNEGYDIVYLGVSGSFLIGNNVEQARLFGSGNSLTGNAQDNLLVGNTLVASAVDGGGGNDLIYGGAMGDVLVGGANDDTLYGLGGADQFRFNMPAWGADQIADFSQAEGDKLHMINSGVSSFAQLTIISGVNTLIIASPASSIYLFNVSSVTASDFIFA